MGFGDFIGSASESVKQNVPDAVTPVKNVLKASYNYGSSAFTKIDQVVRIDGFQKVNLGFGDFIGSAAESVKRNAPDAATPVKNVLETSYNYGSSALTKIDQVVRIDGFQKVMTQLMPADETKSTIGLYASALAKNTALHALKEGYKLVPGGVAISDIVSKTLNDVKHENLKIEKVKASNERPKEHLSGGGRKINDVAANVQCKGIGNSDIYPMVSSAEKTPEDVIRIFMMKEYLGTRFFDDPIVPQVTKSGNKAHE